VIATFCSAVLVDKAGRRKLLILSEIGSTISMLTLTVFFYFKELDPTLATRMGWIPLLSLGSFIVFFSIGIGPVPFLMLAELNSSKMIGVASAAATTVNWTFAYLVTLIFMLLEAEYGMHVCFAIFTVSSLVGVIFACVCVPETKGKSMEDIQKYFLKSAELKPSSVCKEGCTA
jgi:MFS family permease